MSISLINFGAALVSGGAPTSAVRQVETATADGSITGSGDLTVIVTAAGMTGSPKTISVPVLSGDTAPVWAGKVRTALAADADVTAIFTVSGTTTAIKLTKILADDDDATLNIDLDNGTCTGATAAHTSVDTAAGVRGDYHGVSQGQIVLDTSGFAFYQNSGTPDFPTWGLMASDLTTVNLGTSLVVSSAPSNGDFSGAATGQVAIDTTNKVVYINTGTPGATVWTAQ